MPIKLLINFPTPPNIAHHNINLGLSKFKLAINIDAPAIESPRIRIRFGVGEKYGLNFIFLILNSNNG